MILKDEIRKLVELQKSDLEIYKLIQDKDVVKPASLEELKKTFTDNKKNLIAAEAALKAAMVKKKDKELELSSKEEDNHKGQAQLYQLKSNKEYQAKLTEIASRKADISILEDQIIKLMEDVERKDAEVKAAKEAFSQDERKFKDEEAKINTEISELAVQIKIIEDRRVGISRDVDAAILKIYESTLKKRAGLAIVPVHDQNCGACHMSLTHQKLNEIKMYGNLVFCDSCVRIMYIPEDLEQ